MRLLRRHPPLLAVPVLWCAVALAAASGPDADAATLVDRNPIGNRVSLKVNARNIALLEYRTKGRMQHVLAWGAVNLSAAKFELDYSGGWASRVAQWRTLRNVCRPFDPATDPTLGPGAELVVAACRMPDGSSWAVQTWPRLIPNYGGTTGANEIFVSHWKGEIATLRVEPDWSRYASRTTGQHYQHLFGTLTYRGIPIQVGTADKRGNPLDAQGRNVYVDALDSTYTTYAGWSRVNAFLAQRPAGQFCYVFQSRPLIDNSVHRIAEPWLSNARQFSGDSRQNRYRATVVGPGATPLVRTYWDGMAGPFDQAVQDQRAALALELIGAGNQCAQQGG